MLTIENQAANRPIVQKKNQIQVKTHRIQSRKLYQKRPLQTTQSLIRRKSLKEQRRNMIQITVQ